MSYENKLVRIRPNGGSVKVTIASNVGQGNGGTTLKCAGCWVSSAAANTGPVKMNIASAANANLGIELPKSDAANPLWVPISDVSKLYFYSGTDGDIVDITYLKG